MAKRKCRDCTAGCYLIPEPCLYAGTYIKAGQVRSDDILPFMEEAQRFWVTPLLGSTCLASLCSAIVDYEDNNTAIPASWQAMITAMEGLLKHGTVLLFLRRRGFLQVKQDGIISFPTDSAAARDMWNDLLADAEATVKAEVSLFKTWIADNRLSYPCLPALPCNPPDTSVQQGFGGFSTTSGNPSSILSSN